MTIMQTLSGNLTEGQDLGSIDAEIVDESESKTCRATETSTDGAAKSLDDDTKLSGEDDAELIQLGKKREAGGGEPRVSFNRMWSIGFVYLFPESYWIANEENRFS